MKAIPTTIEGVLLFEPSVFRDDRGYFFESFNEKDFVRATGLDGTFVQDNQSYSKQGVLRGLHFQEAPYAQGKLVRATLGTIFDVAVDLRPESRSFGKWVGYELSSENNLQLWIPPGCAHGFLTISEIAIVAYKTTDFWASSYERCIRWDDSDIAIDWPLSEEPVLSPKDAIGLSLYEYLHEGVKRESKAA